MRIDLNADLGESFGRWRLGDDEAMLDIVTSANVACGFHAGDPTTLKRTCAEATARGVIIGAQVGYRDLAGFGRRYIDVAPEDLEADVLYQLGALDAMARAGGGRVRYVKPHGALYNTAVTNEAQAEAVVAAVADYDRTLAVLGLPGSALVTHARGLGLRTVAEAFADRAYTAAGRLLDRRREGAVLTEPDRIAERAVEMVTNGSVISVEGTTVAVDAESLCVHGDTPGAVEIARAVRSALTDAGVRIEAFDAG
ncbi:MAG TPA: 5-oxoprolinase subunit PxpA [Jatrophihabitantaceae bacterium]|nr:5-oxoprolinase subunit PxpA [Jatrophihabitantaceae bacterium]